MTCHNWKSYKLGELGEFLNGVNFSRGAMGKGFKLINVKDIFDKKFLDFMGLDEVDLPGKKNIGKYLVQKNDLFFVRSSVKRDGIGLVSVATKSDDKAVHCGFVIRFRLNAKNINPIFLTYLLRSPEYRAKIINVSGGAAIINISQETLSRFQVSIPDIDNQNRIVGILFGYDNLILNNSKRIEILESMAKLIYDEWFVKFKFLGHEKVKMVNSEIGEIPEGWEVKKLSEVIEFKKGKQAKNILEKPNSDALPYLLIRGIKTGSHVYTNEKGVYTSRKDILMVMDGASSGRVYIGQEGYVGSTLALIDIKDKSVSPEYIMLFLISNFNHISSNNTGAAIPHANKEFMYQMDIVLPKKEMREPLFSFFENLFTMKTTLELKNINLRKTRDLLLPKLMSGEIDVSELDIKVPVVAA